MMNGEIATREDHESHLQPLQGAPGATGVLGRARPGILIYSHKRRLLHVNSRALEMRGLLDRVDTESAGMALASSVNEIRIQLQGIMGSGGETSIGELVESKRVIVEDGREILVRGFGLASRQSHGDFRIVIVLEEENVRQDHQPQQARVPSSTSRCTVFSENKSEALQNATDFRTDHGALQRRQGHHDLRQNASCNGRSAQNNDADQRQDH